MILSLNRNTEPLRHQKSLPAPQPPPACEPPLPLKKSQNNFPFGIENRIGLINDEEQWTCQLDDNEAVTSIRFDTETSGKDNASGQLQPIDLSASIVKANSTDTRFQSQVEAYKDQSSTPAARFELMLSDGCSIQIDMTRQLRQWNLSLQTSETAVFKVLTDSRERMRHALETAFTTTVIIQIDQT